MGYQRARQGRAEQGRAGYDKAELGVSASALLVSPSFSVFEVLCLRAFVQIFTYMPAYMYLSFDSGGYSNICSVYLYL